MIKLRKRKRSQLRSCGFTLIELIVVMLLLGILAFTAIPRFLDLIEEAKISATKAGLAEVRAALNLEYANNAISGTAQYPATLTGSSFTDGLTPLNQLNEKRGVAALASEASGTAASATDGFWMVQGTGIVGAYSDGSIDTSSW